VVTPDRGGRGGSRLTLMDRIIAAGLGALVLAWTTTAQAQPPAPSPAPAAETTSAPAPAPSLDETLSRHLHVLTPQEPTPEGILAHEPAGEVAIPQLRQNVPGLAEGMEQLPPFLRDTSLKLHLRSFYFNRLNSDDTRNEAWAFGGWLAYKSGWLWDAFALGAVGYTSQPLYAPEDRGGTDLLHGTAGSPQGSILVLGQAYAQLRYQEYALLTGYRQLVDEGYLNPHDSRMVPKTFEGVTVKGTIGPIGYDVGYLTAIKLRQDNKFHNMAETAGVSGDKDRGLVLTRLSSEPVPGLSLYAANYLVPDVFNTGYGFAEYTDNLTSDLSFKIGLQATDQRSVGAAFLGNFRTWNVNTRGILTWRGLGVGAGFSATGEGSALQTPYGDPPGYFTFQENNFDQARQKAWGLAARYDFGPGTLFPGVHIPGLSVLVRYAEGRDAVNPSTGVGLPTLREGNLDVIWNVPGVPGLQFRFRNAYVESGHRVLPAFRIILNYELPLL
jgi:outer membrane porin, OprD family